MCFLILSCIKSILCIHEARRCSKVFTTCTPPVCSIQKKRKKQPNKKQRAKQTFIALDGKHPETALTIHRGRGGVSQQRVQGRSSLATFGLFQTEGSSVCLESEEGKRRGKKKSEGETRILLTMSADPSFCLLPPRLAECRHTDCSR